MGVRIEQVELRENVRAFFPQGHSKTLHACNNEVSVLSGLNLQKM